MEVSKQYNQLNTKAVSKQWLENKIKELNDWLFENDKEGRSYKRHIRNYYVNKLIELEENQLKTIKV